MVGWQRVFLAPPYIRGHVLHGLALSFAIADFANV